MTHQQSPIHAECAKELHSFSFLLPCSGKAQKTRLNPPKRKNRLYQKNHKKQHKKKPRSNQKCFGLYALCFVSLSGGRGGRPCLVLQRGVVSCHLFNFAHYALQAFTVRKRAQFQAFRASFANAFRRFNLRCRLACRFARRLHKNIARALLNKARSTLVFILARSLRATTGY